jgi:hypothetical protein
MTRKKTSKDYPPEFLETWELASKNILRLAFPTKGQAINFRQRLHAFRRVVIEESGQGAFNHWFKHDLVVEQLTPAIWLLKTGEPSWKLQVREQAAKAGVATPVLPSPQIQNPSSVLPEGLGPVRRPSHEEIPLSISPKTEEAMSNALSKLGFGTDTNKQ